MNNILKALSSIPILRNLSPEQLDQFGQIAIEKIFNKNQLIFQDGDKSDGIYMIVEGTVKVFKLSHNGKEHILFYFSAGQIFGEISVFFECFKRRFGESNRLNSRNTFKSLFKAFRSRGYSGRRAKDYFVGYIALKKSV